MEHFGEGMGRNGDVAYLSKLLNWEDSKEVCTVPPIAATPIDFYTPEGVTPACKFFYLPQGL